MADGPLFIVDNAPGGRTGLGYLKEWCELATSFDIATGFFDLGSLLALDGDWQKLEGIRLLMGGDVGAPTRKALLAAVKARATNHLDESVEVAKQLDPFLEGADAVVEAIATGKISCRVYDRDKFHAKAYITHGKFDVVGSQALVGSSNFTRAGLTQNVELNLKVESSAEVDQLQRWYEAHWAAAAEVNADVLETIERHTQPFSPFEIYAKSLESLVAKQDPSSADWDRHSSRMFHRLDRYQQEAYGALVDIAKQHNGALLCDGVGLGKTYVGLQLIERLILHEGKRVVLLAPKAVREAVWEKELRTHLSHIGGFGGSGDFSNLTVFNHTDLTRGGDFPERFSHVARLADAVVIDEAHHFRNRGRMPDPEDPLTWSRYHRLAEVVNGGGRDKELYLLTATPINNSLNDFRHLVELFTNEDDAAFARTLGVPSVTARLNALTREVQQQLGADAELADAPDRLQDVLIGDALFTGLVVQRSRAYAKQSQILERGEATAFPERLPPVVAAYSLRKSHGQLIELLDESFERAQPLFSLSIYYPLAFYQGPDASIDPKEGNRQKQVVGLIRTNFLKRFESSVYAFERSCTRLLDKLLAFLEVNMTTDAQRRTRERWLLQHQQLLAFVAHRQLDLLSDEDAEDPDTDDLVPHELRNAFEPLPPDQYDVPGICADALLDLEQVARLLEGSRRFEPKDDDKLRTLLKLLREDAKHGRKTLVFTEFADTARYLERQLKAAGIDGVEELDGSRGVDRADVIERFSPYYNGSDSPSLEAAGRAEIRVLVATDVLSEGLNLQDATRLVNYDIHWNPVRLMQRIGRVDRRLNPAVEKRIIDDHPELEEDRGVVAIHNFLPPEELEDLLRLYEKVTFKTLLISATLGIEGRQFLRPDDDYQALVEFNAEYEGATSQTEQLHLELQQLLKDDPALQARLDDLPGGVFSGRAANEPGVFLCYELPALDTTTGLFSLDAGATRWYLRRADGTIVEDVGVVADTVRCKPDAKRVTRTNREALLTAKAAVEAHVRNTYLRSLDVPMDAPEPRLVAWMDLSA